MGTRLVATAQGSASRLMISQRWSIKEDWGGFASSTQYLNSAKCNPCVVSRSGSSSCLKSVITIQRSAASVRPPGHIHGASLGTGPCWSPDSELLVPGAFITFRQRFLGAATRRMRLAACDQVANLDRRRHDKIVARAQRGVVQPLHDSTQRSPLGRSLACVHRPGMMSAQATCHQCALAAHAAAACMCAWQFAGFCNSHAGWPAAASKKNAATTGT